MKILFKNAMVLTMENDTILKDALVAVEDDKIVYVGESCPQWLECEYDRVIDAAGHMVMPGLPEESLLDMFLGLCPGSIGELSALALLIGGVYLVIRKVISVRIPLAYLGTVAVITLIFPKAGNPVEWMLYSLLSGGVMLGAIFMATDYATSPATAWGQIIFGIGCGILTVIFRYFGIFPEGVTYAILLMNACVWVIDRYTAPRRFGVKKGGAKA